MLIENDVFSKWFNEKIFSNSKIELLEKMAKYPDRYVGIFRPTKPKMKIIQNLTQSHEIRFGDAMEFIIEKYIEKMGYEILPKQLKTNDGDLSLDQCFRKNNIVYFVEQKVRDDHDSTKKRGQVDNFEKKIFELVNKYGEKNLRAYFYFIDPSLMKNKSYYQQEILKIERNYGVKTKLCYGENLFCDLEENCIWDELVENLKLWKEKLPDFPEINFDLSPQESFEEIKHLKPLYFLKILDNELMLSEIFDVIFPNKKTLHILLNYFETRKSLKIYETLYQKLSIIL